MKRRTLVVLRSSSQLARGNKWGYNERLNMSRDMWSSKPASAWGRSQILSSSVCRTALLRLQEKEPQFNYNRLALTTASGPIKHDFFPDGLVSFAMENPAQMGETTKTPPNHDAVRGCNPAPNRWWERWPSCAVHWPSKPHRSQDPSAETNLIPCLSYQGGLFKARTLSLKRNTYIYILLWWATWNQTRSEKGMYLVLSGSRWAVSDSLRPHGL